MSRRENGFGTLINKGEGKPFLAKWTYQGKPYYKSTGEVDRKKALKVLEKLTRPFREENKVEVLRNLEAKVKSVEDEIKLKSLKLPGIKLSELSDKVLSKLEFSDITEATLDEYNRLINLFCNYVSKNYPKCLEMKDVNESIVENYLIYFSKNWGNNTFNNSLALLKRVWDIMKDEGHYLLNVFEKFEFKKIEPSIRRELTTEELYKIFEEIKDDEEFLCLFSLGIYTGLRFSDCCCLKWSEVDIVKRTISVIPIKTKKHSKGPIVIPIHNSLFNIIMLRWQNKNDNEYVMPNMFSGYKKKTLRVRIWRLLNKCGIKTYDIIDGKKRYIVGFHSLRHTFVSLNINSGMSPMLVQNIVGHHSIDMTRHYFHSNEGVIRNGINNMPDLLGCSDYIDMSVKDSDVELLKEVFDKDKDKSLSDTLKRVIEYYKTYSKIIDVA